mmetsp:Transcript_78397/g.156817  ORF Transcript_78397/g.156817 Transcript_78397/m.156817 type:complete len:358 (+) Transcript_78397:306-1379(+)|eukprot:CAMPEP_0171620584 /NCGR_PEP_ID=MMETSP0990-20121206/16075_1 /TAXON_ID=483369 /ORGANISM="non described non described, Strain CCMP2098" /LENGTH=357 /DNA_ID=CAMNT_0012185899 /DNA_START=449 /DNA_END=1522 /DNA_ORIENTATION=-
MANGYIHFEGNGRNTTSRAMFLLPLIRLLFLAALPTQAAGEGGNTVRPSARALVGDGGCETKNGTLICKDIDFQKDSVVKRNTGGLYFIELESYRRIQAVPRPPGCEGFVLFPRLMGADPSKGLLTLERFGTPMGCKVTAYVREKQSCCGRMCDTLPVNGEIGLCQQLSCIAAVLHLANVTDLDMEPKNVLFGTRPMTKGGPPQAQVALYDFDLTAIITTDPHDSTKEKLWTTQAVMFKKGLETIGGVISRLVRVASVGYLQCAGPPLANRTFHQHVACPFKAMLKKMLPQPGVLSYHDLASLDSLEKKGVIARTATCGMNLPYDPAYDTHKLASILCTHQTEENYAEALKKTNTPC